MEEGKEKKERKGREKRDGSREMEGKGKQSCPTYFNH